MGLDLIILSLGIGVAFLSVAARRLRAAPSILMLLAGVAIAFVPGLPTVTLKPDLVLLLLLPPLLYWSGVGMSWREFRLNLRPILLLAIGCVLATAAAVAAVAHFALGLSWPLGFMLGAIVSPPDAVAPMALMRHLRLPRRLVTILEGESLVNDATALVIFSFALDALLTGSFSPTLAAAKFFLIIAGEVGFGIAVGWIMLRLRHFARDPRAEVMLALVTPFVAFWPPHGIGGSGVIACVAAGLYVSWNGRRLIRPDTRLQGFFIWDLVTWTIEALTFLLMGLQARLIAGNLSAAGWAEFLQAGSVVTLTTIVARFAWVYAGTYLPRLIPMVRRREPAPDRRIAFMVSFTGLRGVVSLAAALSIPMMRDGQPFPGRDLVLFIAFFTVVATLVGFGSVLRWVAHGIGLDHAGRDEAVKAKRDERAARLKGIRAVLKELEQVEAEGQQQAVSVGALQRYHSDRLALLTATADETTQDEPAADAARLQLRLISAERTKVMGLYDEGRITDETRRRIERELDLEEARSKHAEESAASVRGDTP